MVPASTHRTGPISSEAVREDPSLAELAAVFVAGLGERLREMENAIRATDFDRLRVVAHQLKGSGGGYGYPILTEQAGQLERDARGQCLDACVSTFADLREICSRIVVSE